jgi:hypothetical protein
MAFTNYWCFSKMSSRQFKRSSKTSKTSQRKNKNRSQVRDSKITLSKTLSAVFPDFLRTKMRTSVNFTYNNTATAILNIMHANDVLRCGPASTYTGLSFTSFTNNVPTGLAFLLGNNVTAAGSTSPYAKYRVYGSSIDVQWVGNTSVAASAVYEGTRIIVIPHVTDTPGVYNHTGLSSMSTSQLMEQPYSKSFLSPHIQQAKPLHIHHRMTTLKMFGLRYQASLEADVGYSGTINGSSSYAPPNNKFDWVVILASADNSATVTGDIVINIDYDVEFTSRNSFTTSVPT